MTDTLRPALQDGIARLNITVPEDAVTRLLEYCALLQKWNRVYNLTAIRAPE